MIKQKGLLTITDISPNGKETEIIVPVMDYSNFSIGDPLPIFLTYPNPQSDDRVGIEMNNYNVITRFTVKSKSNKYGFAVGHYKTIGDTPGASSITPRTPSDWTVDNYYLQFTSKAGEPAMTGSGSSWAVKSFVEPFNYYYSGNSENYWAADKILLLIYVFLPCIVDNKLVFPLFYSRSIQYYQSGYEKNDRTDFYFGNNPTLHIDDKKSYGYLIPLGIHKASIGNKTYECILFNPSILPDDTHTEDDILSDIESDVISPYRSRGSLLQAFVVNDYTTLTEYVDEEETVTVIDDPYDNDPDSQGNNDPGGHKGGNGKYQDTDEDVPIPGLPTISATDTGLCTLYNPSKTELKELSDYLWSDVFSVESFKKIFADPMDIILGMSIVPLKVSDGARAEIKVGGLSTGVSMNKCKTQYIEVDCGSLDISNYWDNFMDYDPYTHYTLYLPYVGYKVIHADELVDKTITVKYHCDILSGACMAYVQCGKKVLYCFEGNISIQIPVTSASYDNMIHGILQMASGVGQIIAGGASMAAGGAGAGLMVSGAVGTATGATSAIKPTIGRSGNAESSTGLMGIQKPYLIISRPRAVVPSGLNKYSGYPAYKGGKLGDFNNFTVVQDIRIKNLNGATMEEMNEAERLCKEGVIV